MRSKHKDMDLFWGKITTQGSGILREENPGYQARNLVQYKLKRICHF